MKQMNMAQYCHYWLVTFKKHAVKPSSYKRLETSYNKMQVYPIATMLIDDITIMDIQEYIQQLRIDGYSLSNIKKMARIVSAPLKFAAANKWISADPGTGMVFPAKSQFQSRDVTAYEPQEQTKIKAEIDTWRYPAYPAILMILEEGMRPGEVLALDWGDIDSRRNAIHVHKTIARCGVDDEEDEEASDMRILEGAKTYCSNRYVPITPKMRKVLDILRRTEKTGPDDPIFRSMDGTRLTYDGMRWQARQLAENAGVPYKGLHVYRHTFATNCYYKKIDIKLLSKMLGHSSTQVTYDTYINLYGDGFDDLNAVFG